MKWGESGAPVTLRSRRCWRRRYSPVGVHNVAHVTLDDSTMSGITWGA
jgi:hypothetical protein